MLEETLNDKRDLQLLMRLLFLSENDVHTLLMLGRLGLGDRDGKLALVAGPSCMGKQIWLVTTGGDSIIYRI